jgi:hypothetical protein
MRADVDVFLEKQIEKIQLNTLVMMNIKG